MSYAQQNWNNPNVPLTQYGRSVGLGLAMMSAISSPAGATKLAAQVASLSSAGATVWGGAFIAPSPPAAPDSAINKELETIWGYVGKGGIIYQYMNAVIVAKDEGGNYYRWETTGHGASLSASISLKTLEPGSKCRLYAEKGWGAEVHATLVAMLDADMSAMGRIDAGGYSWEASERAYLAFSTPDLSLMVSKTGSMKQISRDDVFSKMPRWVKRAYEKEYGGNYKSVLSR